MTKALEYEVSLKIQSVCVAMCSLVMRLSSCDFLRHREMSLTELNSCKIFRNHIIKSDLKWSQHIHQIAVKANCTLYHFLKDI